MIFDTSDGNLAKRFSEVKIGYDFGDVDQSANRGSWLSMKSGVKFRQKSASKDQSVTALRSYAAGHF